jgi:hypothetical protein
MASYTRAFSRYHGGDSIWVNKTNASVIVEKDFFGLLNVNLASSQLNLELNNVVLSGGASLSDIQINLQLDLNNAVTKGQANLETISENLLLNILNVDAFSDLYRSGNAYTNSSNLTLVQNNVSAAILPGFNYELVSLYSKINNKIEWEKSIKVKLTLQSKLR